MMLPTDLVVCAPLSKWPDDYIMDTSDDVFHGFIIQQLLTKLSFCNFFSHKVQSFRQREVAVYLCCLK